MSLGCLAVQISPLRIFRRKSSASSNWAKGYFFEGAMTRGMPKAHAMDAVQSNIVAAGYAGQLKP